MSTSAGSRDVRDNLRRLQAVSVDVPDRRNLGGSSSGPSGDHLGASQIVSVGVSDAGQGGTARGDDDGMGIPEKRAVGEQPGHETPTDTAEGPF